MFFQHDEMCAAIRHLHPALIHGPDYLVLMGIKPDGTPASDAWIERWPDGLAVPTLQALKDAYKVALTTPAPPAPAPTSTTSLGYMARFTEAEKTAIYSAAMVNAQLLRFITELAAAQEVVFADPRLAAGMDRLVMAGLLTQARSEAILPLAVRTTGMTPL